MRQKVYPSYKGTMSGGGTSRIYQVNLEELIEKYVWKLYRRDIGFFKRLTHRRGKFYMDIRWGYVDFKHDTKETPRPTDVTKRKNTELYFSEYENKTNGVQTYTFSTSRETTASTKIELQENYTIGAETNLEVDLGFLKVGGGVNGAVSITETKGQEFSETLTWDINTEIKVEEWSKAKASLRVYEQPAIYDFEVKTEVSLPKKKLPVSIRRVDDGRIMQTYWITNLACLFDEEYLKRSTVKIKETVDQATDMIDISLVLTTHGVVKNLAWKNQHVEVESFAIERPEGAQADDEELDKET